MRRGNREQGARNMGDRNWISIALLCIFLSAGTTSFSQDPQASVKLKSELLRIGEQTQVTLRVQYRKDKGIKSIQFPLLKDTLVSGIEILSQSKVETYAPDKNDPSALVDSQTVIITCFDSGYYAIPPLRFFINNDPGKSIETEAVMLTVNTVKADTTKAPKEIKPPLEEPFTFADALPYIIVGVGVAALITGLILLYNRHRKKPIVLLPKAPPVPPHVIAIKKLEELHEKKLWQEGKLKEYHSALTDILREYIEHSFPCNAMELTTEEIMYRFRRINIPKEAKSQLKQALLLADMVKFAKEIPLAEENELSYMNAITFVRSTKEDEEKKDEEIIEQP
jgi:hypothetical protein